jgi:FkbM family methyltransferase
MRRLMERLSRNVVLKRRLPSENGGVQLFVSPGASLRFWRPGLQHADPLLLEVARRFLRRRAVVWDIGANVGLFAFAAAAQVGESGKVLAVEPDSWLVSLMKRSSSLPDNVRFDLEILQAAACDTVGTAPFAVARRSRAASHLSIVSGSSPSGGVAEEVLVPTVTLDWLLGRHWAPDFIKIDVEGAELLVLNGARRLLADVKPAIYCEVSSECCPAVTALLHEHGYKLYDPLSDTALAKPLDSAVWNTLALPAGYLPSPM